MLSKILPFLPYVRLVVDATDKFGAAENTLQKMKVIAETHYQIQYRRDMARIAAEEILISEDFTSEAGGAGTSSRHRYGHGLGRGFRP